MPRMIENQVLLARGVMLRYTEPESEWERWELSSSSIDPPPLPRLLHWPPVLRASLQSQREWA